MASVTNSVSRLVYEVCQKSGVEEDMVSLKDLARSVSHELIRRSEEAFRKVAGRGAGLVENGDRLMTCSYSSTVCQALRMAKLGGKDFLVLAAQSGSGGRAYGEITANELKSFGIGAEVIPDSNAVDCMKGVNKVLVGADSLLVDGWLINGVPTLAMALAARESHVPFYSLCERAKFDARPYPGKPGDLEEGFDWVPLSLITGIVTEEGMVEPGEIADYMKEMTGYVQFLNIAGNSDGYRV